MSEHYPKIEIRSSVATSETAVDEYLKVRLGAYDHITSCVIVEL